MRGLPDLGQTLWKWKEEQCLQPGFPTWLCANPSELHQIQVIGPTLDTLSHSLQGGAQQVHV